jgi:hypothetical protein
MIGTADPFVVIEEQRAGYVRYLNTQTGRRWEVSGTCDKRGDCVVGAVITAADGSTVTIASLDHLRQLLRQKKWQLAITANGLDTPVTPEFNTCCAAAGLLTITEL